MASPLDVFRKTHAARVFTGQTVVKGVMVPGTAIDTSIKCSVQKIGRTQQEILTARGKRISDFRRIYSDSKLPISEEQVAGVVSRIPLPSDLLTAAGEVIDVVDGKGQPGQVQIDGLWYEVAERHPMQNGVINHFQYLLFRVNANDQNI